MQGECEPSRSSPCELGLLPPIDTGDICEAFSSLKLLERTEVGAGEVEMLSAGSDREREDWGGGGTEKDEERVESGDGEREGGEKREEGRDGERENVESEKRDEVRDGDSGNVKTECDGDSEKKRGEEERGRDLDTEGEIGVGKQRIDCGSEHEEGEVRYGGIEKKEIGEKEEDKGEEKEEEMECTNEKKEEEKVPKVKLPISYPQRPFTPDCLTYLKSGYCSFGMACCFNHPLKKSSNVSLNGNCKEKEGVGDQEKKALVGGGRVINARYYPLREGKEDCAFYMKTGRCDYGFKCCFNHPLRNHNQVMENREDQTASDDTKGLREAYMNWAVGSSKSHIRRRPDCARYIKEGRCDYGAECRFFHHRSRRPYEFNWNPGRNWQEKHEFETNFLGFPLRPGKDDCPEYMKHGACELSTGCQYNHPNPGPVIDTQYTRKESNKSDTLPYLEGHAPERLNPLLARIKQMLLPPERPADTGEVYEEIEAQQLSSFSLEGSRNGCELLEYPARPGEPLCPAYIKSGTCKLKSECWYDHPKGPTNPAVQSEGYNRKSSTMDGNKKVVSIMWDEEFIYPERPGEPECLYYMNYGNCKFRSSCIFHHPRHLLNKGANYSSRVQASGATLGNCYEESKYPERPGEPECAYFMMHSDCKFQSSCKFHHPKGRNEKAATYSSFAQASRMVSRNFYEEIIYPERPGEPECAYYTMHGDCKFQSDCKFHHPKGRNEKKSSQGGSTKFVPKKSQNQFAALEIT